MTTVILVNILIFLLGTLVYVIWNLNRKNILLEDAVIKRDNVLVAMSDVIKDSDKRLKEVDRLGSFASDDEINFIFKAIQEIQQRLNDFKV
jgi:hypothetical protein